MTANMGYLELGDRHKIFWQDDGEGIPCLLIPGSGGTVKGFEERVAPYFRAAGFRTIILDHRGTGRSTYDGQDFTISDLRDDVIALIKHLGIGPVLLFGMSMGSYIAQEIAVSRPDLVCGAVLVATLGRQTEFARRNFKFVIPEARGELALPAEAKGLYHAMQLLSPVTLTDDALASAYLDFWDSGRVELGDVFAQQMEACESYDNRLDALAVIECPCLIISYAHDLCTPANRGREVADAICNSQFLLIENAGHLGFLEKPDETYSACMSFLKNVIGEEARGG
jgi:pimeloyl-ACP methyl ester carboxylesterase